MERRINPSVHSALEVAAAPMIMVAPFLLGFGQAAAIVAVALGAVLLGHALQLESPRRSVPLSAHAGLDYALATVAFSAGLAVGFATGEWVAGSLLVGVGVALALLAAATRFTVRLGT